MIAFFAALLGFFLQAFRSNGNVLTENAVLKKENEILLRRLGKKRVHSDVYARSFLVVLNRAADIKYQLTLVKPETVLYLQRTLIKRFWTFEHAPAKRGRKPVDTDVKNLILSMKNDNLLWGMKRIQGPVPHMAHGSFLVCRLCAAKRLPVRGRTSRTTRKGPVSVTGPFA
jgi:hypothetical protein